MSDTHLALTSVTGFDNPKGTAAPALDGVSALRTNHSWGMTLAVVTFVSFSSLLLTAAYFAKQTFALASQLHNRDELFTKERWQSWDPKREPQQRILMFEDLKSELLILKPTRLQSRALLGEPDQMHFPRVNGHLGKDPDADWYIIGLEVEPEGQVDETYAQLGYDQQGNVIRVAKATLPAHTHVWISR